MTKMKVLLWNAWFFGCIVTIIGILVYDRVAYADEDYDANRFDAPFHQGPCYWMPTTCNDPPSSAFDAKPRDNLPRYRAPEEQKQWEKFPTPIPRKHGEWAI